MDSDELHDSTEMMLENSNTVGSNSSLDWEWGLVNSDSEQNTQVVAHVQFSQSTSGASNSIKQEIPSQEFIMSDFELPISIKSEKVGVSLHSSGSSQQAFTSAHNVSNWPAFSVKSETLDQNSNSSDASYTQNRSPYKAEDDDERKHICTWCTKRFKRKDHLNKHLLTHTGERPFKCDLCPKRFITSDKLKEHNFWHQGIKPYKCTECDLGFCNRFRLKTHMMSHTGEKPFTCDVCNKGFRTKHQLKTHHSVHVGEEEEHYKCEVCGLTFTNKAAQQQHLATQH